MKLSIQKNILNDAIQQVSRAASTRPTIPILGGIKLDVAHDSVTLSASDTEIAIQSIVYAEQNHKQVVTILKEGSVVVPAKFFAELVKKLPGNEIYIETTDRFDTIIRAGSFETKISGLDPEEFPAIPTMMEGKTFQVPGDLIKSMIKQTVFATSTSEQTPILTGIRWSVNQNLLQFAATDRHRLATRTATIPNENQTNYFPNVVIGSKTVNELSKLIADQELIEIQLSNTQVLFKMSNSFLFSKVIDGTYPDIDKVIPKQFKTELVVHTKSLTDAIDRAYLMSREDHSNVVHIISQQDQTILVSSGQPETTIMKESVGYKEMTGDSIKIAFNSKYMLDTLKVIDSEFIYIGLNGAMSPIIVKPVDHQNSLYLILPFRTT